MTEETNYGLFKPVQLLNLLYAHEGKEVKVTAIDNNIEYTIKYPGVRECCISDTKTIKMRLFQIYKGERLYLEMDPADFLIWFTDAQKSAITLWKVGYDQFDGTIKEGDYNSPELYGYVVFTVTVGIIDEMSFKLYKSKEAAIDRALEIIQAEWESDRYVNPNHPQHTSIFKELSDEEYERRRRAVRKLQSVDLSEETDLEIRPVTEA